MSKTISPYIYKYFTIFVSIHFSQQYFETISRIREMGDSVEFDDNLIHDRDADEDIYAAVYRGDIVSFVHNGKILSGIIESLFEVNGIVNRIAIKSLDQLGSVKIYNVRGDSENNAIESLFVMKELMPLESRNLDNIHEKMFVTFSGCWGDENIGGQVKSVDRTNQKNVRLTIDPVVIDQRPEEKEPLSMDMSDSETISAVRQSSEGGIEVDQKSIGVVYETLLPFPQQEPRFRKQVKTGNLKEIPWSGPAPGFKPGKKIAPYDANLSKDEQCLYDFQFIKQHWRDEDMEEFFEEPTNLKGEGRRDGTESRKVNGVQVDGSQTKYEEGWVYVTVEIMWAFWAAKWGTSFFGTMTIKDLFAEDYVGQANEGQLLHGWSREVFEMLDETQQAHTEADTKATKPFIEQDPYFGVSDVLERLLQRANEIRWPSRWLALDEEIISLLGKSGVIQYAKDKKNQRGPKVFALNGCNFLGSTVESLLEMTNSGIAKGYYHQIELYRGKKRDRPGPFYLFGKGFDVVCRAILAMNLRYQGYFLVCDSWYTSLPLMLQLHFQGINYLGTMKLSRKGLKGKGKDEKIFENLKKSLEKDYDYNIGGAEGAEIPSTGKKRNKKQGYKKGFFECRKIEGLPIIVNIQKDNKVMVEGGNSTQMDRKAIVSRYNKEKRKKEDIEVWVGHSLINLIYGMLDQATAWRTKAGGHKWKTSRWSKTVLHQAMFGVLPTNAYLNMKLANPNDKRTFRQFKKSVCRWSMIHTPALFLRERKRRGPPSKKQAIKSKRPKINPHKCEDNARIRPENQLKAASQCMENGPYRFVRITDYFPKNPGKRAPRFLCGWQDNENDLSTRCRNFADIICTSCGTKWCLRKVAGRGSQKCISHACASHQPKWFYLRGPKKFLLRGRERKA